MSPHGSQVSFSEMDWEQVNLRPKTAPMEIFGQIDKKPTFWLFLHKDKPFIFDFCQMSLLNIVG